MSKEIEEYKYNPNNRKQDWTSTITLIGVKREKKKPMTEQERKDLYDRVLDKFGYNNQKMMLAEECGELLSAISKNSRGRVDEDSVVTELADVAIMIEQMAKIFGWEEVEAEKERKLHRLKERLDDYDGISRRGY